MTTLKDHLIHLTVGGGKVPAVAACTGRTADWGWTVTYNRHRVDCPECLAATATGGERLAAIAKASGS